MLGTRYSEIQMLGYELKCRRYTTHGALAPLLGNCELANDIVVLSHGVTA